MKICLLSYRGNMFSGGQGIYLYYLSRELARRGHQLTILVGPPYPWEMPWARVIKITNHNFYAKKQDFLPRENPFKIFFPLNFYEFALTRFWFFPEMFSFSLRAFYQLGQLISQGERFDLVHDNQCLGYGQLLLKRFALPVIATIHHPLAKDQGADFEQTHSLLERARRVVFYPFIMQKLVARGMDLVISGSRDSAQAVQETFGIAPEKMRVVYDGVDQEVFYPRPEIKRKKGRIIFVGNTEDRKKGILYLIQALSILPRWIHLVIVDGGAKWKFYLNYLIDRYRVRERVEIKEGLSPEELAKEYCRAEVSVVPSLYEGFGLPAAEAMACATPVVSTDAGALPEVVGRDGCGILVPTRNSRALAEKILFLFNQRKLRKEMGEKASERILKYFTWKECARGTEQVYQELLERAKYAHG